MTWPLVEELFLRLPLIMIVKTIHRQNMDKTWKSHNIDKTWTRHKTNIDKTQTRHARHTQYIDHCNKCKFQDMLTVFNNIFPSQSRFLNSSKTEKKNNAIYILWTLILLVKFNYL